MPGATVTADAEIRRARRYLLNGSSDDERAGVEREYFGDERALERVEAAEEHLIEDYLAGRLEADERSLFERNYLAVPHRRTRVETIRGLIAAGQRARAAPSDEVAPTKRWRAAAWAPLAAAALLVIALGGWWMSRSAPIPATATNQPAVASPPASAAPAATAPRVFAFSLSSNRVRSAGASAPLVIPDATDVVRVYLQGAANGGVEGARARVRTVAGTEVWRGPAEAPNDAPAGTIARIDVPAERLPADDYVIELFAADASGADRERARYFLTVRPR